jgi:signal transduction histidine kinase
MEQAPPSRFRDGVRFRLVVGLSLIAAVMLGGAAASIFGLDRLRQGFQLLTDTQLPRLIDAAGLARQSESIVASAPGLVISRDQFTRTTAADRIADQVRFLDELLLRFKSGGTDSETIAVLDQTKRNLLENLGRLDSMVATRIEFDARSESIIRDITDLARRKTAFEATVATGRDGIGQLNSTEFIRWSGETQNALMLILAAYGVERSVVISAFHKQATDAIERADQLVGRIGLAGEADATLRRLHGEIRDRVTASDSVFAARNETLNLQRSVAGMLARNKVISDQFGSAVSGVFETIRHDLEEQTQSYRDFLATYRQALVVATIVAFALALVAFFYVSRGVLRRIEALRDSMLAHADGKEAPIDTAGRDEIGAMARALQFFVTAIRRREEALTESKEQAETALAGLRAAQDRLVQSQKLASLGQLTAGIAHEIKNPLNFVNNFADVSADLIVELREALEPGKAALGEGTRAAVDELTGLLTDNLAMVAQHGRRADSIVKNMLVHSREGGSERRRVDLNASVEESLNLAYHGARAEKPGFNIALEKQLDPAVGEVELYPQEFVRVLLNLISNGFYAAYQRKLASPNGTFDPTLRVATRSLGDRVEIRVRDNGTGISEEVKAKMFNPFFTTKSAGEGTGLGLSLSYDIVVKQHGGTIEVDTEPGAFTEFTITLPRQFATAAAPAKESA